MPIIQFQCTEGHEFEKLMPQKHEVHRWCTHCNELTKWTVQTDPHAAYYKEKICGQCLGSTIVPPTLTVTCSKIEEALTTACTTCGKEARQIIRLRPIRTSKPGGPTIQDSSVRFHFNYQPASDN